MARKKRIRVVAYRNGKRIVYWRRITRKQIKAARKNIKKALKKWMSMSPLKRRKVMPARVKHPKKKYPIGTYMMLDVGKPKGHYQFVQKTKYGWKKVKAPKRLLQAGWKKEGLGYVYKPR